MIKKISHIIKQQHNSEKFGLKLTKAGSLYIVITLLLGFAAVNTGNNLIYFVVSALLGFMAVSGVLGKTNIDKLNLVVEAPQEVYDGQPTLLKIRLQNNKRFLPSFLLELILPEGVTLVSVLESKSEKVTTMPVTFIGRGRKEIEAVTVRSIFPVNFFIRYKNLPCVHSVVVFPSIRPCPLLSHSSGREEGIYHESNQRGSDGDILQIGEYSGSEPMKMIHWKQSARHDELKVKHLSRSTQEPVTIDIDQMEGAMERRLQCACYQINELSRLERPVGLKLAGKYVAPMVGHSHRLRLLQELALYGSN